MVRVLLLVLLSLPVSVQALTTRYVNTGSTAGGDCTTNNTTGTTRACATLRQAIDLMPTTLTDQWRIYCTGATVDTSDVNQGPWDMTTTATNYIEIIGEQSPHHFAPALTGIYDTARYRMECTNRNCVYN